LAKSDIDFHVQCVFVSLYEYKNM